MSDDELKFDGLVILFGVVLSFVFGWAFLSVMVWYAEGVMSGAPLPCGIAGFQAALHILLYDRRKEARWAWAFSEHDMAKEMQR